MVLGARFEVLVAALQRIELRLGGLPTGTELLGRVVVLVVVDPLVVPVVQPSGVLRAAAGAFATGAPALASVVVDHAGEGRVLDVGPVPAGLLDSPLGEAIAAGILEAVR